MSGIIKEDEWSFIGTVVGKHIELSNSQCGRQQQCETALPPGWLSNSRRSLFRAIIYTDRANQVVPSTRCSVKFMCSFLSGRRVTKRAGGVVRNPGTNRRAKQQLIDGRCKHQTVGLGPSPNGQLINMRLYVYIYCEELPVLPGYCRLTHDEPLERLIKCRIICVAYT